MSIFLTFDTFLLNLVALIIVSTLFYLSGYAVFRLTDSKLGIFKYVLIILLSIVLIYCVIQFSVSLYQVLDDGIDFIIGRVWGAIMSSSFTIIKWSILIVLLASFVIYVLLALFVKTIYSTKKSNLLSKFLKCVLIISSILLIALAAINYTIDSMYKVLEAINHGPL